MSKLFLVLLFLLFPNLSFSQEVEARGIDITVNDALNTKPTMVAFKDKDNKTWIKKQKNQCPAYEVKKFNTTTMVKPDINKDKDLTEAEQIEVKEALWNEGLADDTNQVWQEGRSLIHKNLTPAKNDYTDDNDRGTVFYTTTCKNYSFHKVSMPDGITVTKCNFTQNSSNTKAIKAKNITFIDCNLRNIKADASWTLIRSPNIQGAL